MKDPVVHKTRIVDIVKQATALNDYIHQCDLPIGHDVRTAASALNQVLLGSKEAVDWLKSVDPRRQPDPDWNNKSIGMLRLEPAIEKLLTDKLNIHCVGDLLNRSAYSLREEMGHAKINSIRQSLRVSGLYLAGEWPEANKKDSPMVEPTEKQPVFRHCERECRNGVKGEWRQTESAKEE